VSPDGRLYLTWTLNGYPSEVRFAYSPDQGQTFLPYVNPSNTWLGSQGPGTVTANEAGRVFAAWEDTRNDPAGFADDIYCAAGDMTGIEESGRRDAEVGMCRVWPNPARASASIEYTLRQVGSVGVSIYDLTGSLVKRWTRSNAGMGNHIITWNGTDASGQRVSPGIYFVRIETAEGSMSKKLQLLGD
jgi:hypothetical protein